MTETPTSASPADRQRACRARKREFGAPLISVFDRALREALFASYQAGDLSIDIPDVVRRATERSPHPDPQAIAVAGASSQLCWHVRRNVLWRA